MRKPEQCSVCGRAGGAPLTTICPECLRLADRSRCSLCGQPKERVEKLIIGLHGAVCSDCVDLCGVLVLCKPDRPMMAPVSRDRLDARGCLASWLKTVTEATIRDIFALPDEGWTRTFGGCGRSASALTAETISKVRAATAMISGEEPEEGALDEAGRHTAIETLRKASAALGASLVWATEELLASPVTETTLFTLSQMAVNRIWYLDGQLNYIRSMLGESEPKPNNSFG